MFGKYHGQGTKTLRTGTKWVGEFKDGTMDGFFVLTFAKDDLWFNESMHGGNGTKFVGEMKEGWLWNGTFTDGEGNIFGEYVNGERYVNGKSIEKPFRIPRQ